MKAIDIVRNHLHFLGWHSMPIEKRRKIVKLVKRSRKNGANPHTAVARACAEYTSEKADFQKSA